MPQLGQRSGFFMPQTLVLLLALCYTLGMNQLPIAKRIQILNMLVEGSSMRSVIVSLESRLTPSPNSWLTRVRPAYAFTMRWFRMFPSDTCRRTNSGSFCYAKEKNIPHAKEALAEAGSVWTWTALDSDSKLIIDWLVTPGQDAVYGLEFLDRVRSRLGSRVQLTTDGHAAYLEAVEGAFGGDVDFAQLVKLYGPDPDIETRYSHQYASVRRCEKSPAIQTPTE